MSKMRRAIISQHEIQDQNMPPLWKKNENYGAYTISEGIYT